MAKSTEEQGAASVLPLQEDAGAGVEKLPETAKDPSPPPERELTVSELRAALDKAEKREMRNIAPLPVITKTVEQVYGPDVETVTMVFPRPVTIVNAQHVKLRFEEGPQEVPVIDKDNWYLAANKVTLYERPKEEEPGK